MIKTSFANLKLTQTKQIPLYSRIANARRGCFSQCRLHFQQRIMGVSMQLIRHLLAVFEKTLIRLAMEYQNIQHLFSLFHIFQIKNIQKYSQEYEYQALPTYLTYEHQNTPNYNSNRELFFSERIQNSLFSADHPCF